MANRIQLDGQDGDYKYEERIAAAEVYPGHILEVDSAGKVKKHATAGGWGQQMVAVEDALQGNLVSTAYAAAALVRIHIQRPGARFQGRLKAGEDISIGDPLISDGAGCLIAETGTVQRIVGWAQEALDLSGSSAVETLIDVRAD